MANIEQARGLFQFILIFLIIIFIPVLLLTSFTIVFTLTETKSPETSDEDTDDYEDDVKSPEEEDKELEVIFYNAIEKYEKRIIQTVCSIALFLIFCTLLFLALDLSNSMMLTQLHLDWLYNIFYYFYILYFSVILVFVLLYQWRYDCNEEFKKRFPQQVVVGIVGTVITNMVIYVMTGLFFGLLGYTNVPMHIHEQSTYSTDMNSISSLEFGESTVYGYVQVQMSYIVYVVGFITFWAWCVLLVCGSYGMSKYPLHMFLRTPFGWAKGNNRIKKNKYDRIKGYVKMCTENLLMEGIELQKKVGRLELANFRRKVIKYEKIYQQASKRFLGGMSMISSIISILVGALAAFQSILWVIQISLNSILKEKIDVYFSALSIILTLMDMITTTTFYFPFIGYIIYLFLIIHIYLSTMFGLYDLLKFIDGRWLFPRIGGFNKGKTPLFDLIFMTFMSTFASFSIIELAQNAFDGYARSTYLAVLYRKVLHFGYIFDIYFGFIPILFVLLFVIFLIINLIHAYYYSKRIEDREEFLKFIQDNEQSEEKEKKIKDQ